MISVTDSFSTRYIASGIYPSPSPRSSSNAESVPSTAINSLVVYSFGISDISLNEIPLSSEKYDFLVVLLDKNNLPLSFVSIFKYPN